MPLTVADALKEIPLFPSAQVVAGSTGIDRVIRWTHSVTIEDASFQLLAHGVAAPEDDARLRTIAEGQTAEELIAHLTAQGLVEELRKNPAPRRIPPVPELGMTLERVIAPIVVGAQPYGYVWIIATNNPLTDLDFQAIESTAIVAALIITVSVTDTLQRLGLQHGYQIMVIEEISGKAVNLSQLSASIEEKMRSESVAATVIQRGQRLIVLVGTRNGQQGTDAARSLAEMESRQGWSLIIGIGTPSRQAAQVRQCYQEALEALQVGRMLSANQPGVWAFQDLGFLHWLRTRPPDLQSTNRYSVAIRAIEEYDRTHNTEFLKTLEVYLDHLSNRQQAVRAPIIHRNTLNQRLAKIEEN